MRRLSLETIRSLAQAAVKRGDQWHQFAQACQAARYLDPGEVTKLRGLFKGTRRPPSRMSREEILEAAELALSAGDVGWWKFNRQVDARRRLPPEDVAALRSRFGVRPAPSTRPPPEPPPHPLEALAMEAFREQAHHSNFTLAAYLGYRDNSGGWRSGLAQSHLGEASDVLESLVRKGRLRLDPDGWYRRADRPAGSGRYATQTKLREQDVKEILRRRPTGAEIRRTAERLGVTRQTLQSILDGSSWQHLPRS